MATYTTNYNLAKPEGTDAYNHLIYDNPNMDIIDAALKSIDDLTVSRATCVKTGTNHAVTRLNTDAVVFRFTATGDFNAGDTMTVDGVSVSVFLPNGEAANTGAYIINSEVLAAIQGTRVTLYTNALNQIAADHVTYDNTTSGLTANDTQAAIDELDNTIDEMARGLQGLSVDITGYIAPNNTYTCPSDGYIMTVLPAATTGKVEVSIQPNGIVAWTTLPDSTNAVYGAIYVKKNTQVYVSTNTVTNAKVLFRY